jgi:hypothetical protein
MLNKMHLYNPDSLDESKTSFCGLSVTPGNNAVSASHPNRSVRIPLVLHEWCTSCMTCDDYVLWILSRM